MAVASSLTFARRLRELREEAGISPSELARRSGLTRQGVSQLEKGEREPTFETARKLARGLGVSVAAFDVEEETPAPTAVPAPAPKPPPTRPKRPKKK